MSDIDELNKLDNILANIILQVETNFEKFQNVSHCHLRYLTLFVKWYMESKKMQIILNSTKEPTKVLPTTTKRTFTTQIKTNLKVVKEQIQTVINNSQSFPDDNISKVSKEATTVIN